MKFKTVGSKKIMIALDEEGKKIWYYASQKAYEGAKQYLKEGDEVEISLAEEEKDGLKVITFIKKVGQSGSSPEKEAQFKCTECGCSLKDAKYTKCWNCNQKGKNDDTVKNFDSNTPKCIECGKELKDSKYKKCYACNQKNPVKIETASNRATSIEKQNVNNAVSRSLIALQGQLDLNNIVEVIDTLWAKYYSKLK